MSKISLPVITVRDTQIIISQVLIFYVWLSHNWI